MASDLNKLSQEVAEHRGRVEEFIANTTSYRKDLCAKLENIRSTLAELPCKERKAWYDSMGKQLNFMWLVMSIILAVLVVGSVRGIIDRSDIQKSLTTLKQGVVAEAAQCVKQEMQNDAQNAYNSKNDRK
jgi:hypothetical protein